MTYTKKYEKLPQNVEDAAKYSVDSAYTVHKQLGPGLLEKVYEHFMIVELRKRGCNVQTQVKLPINYEGVTYDEYYTIDMLVDDCLILEFKTLEEVKPVHKAQLLTYLRLSGKRLGLLINFYNTNIGDGITRMTN
jgi:GxxExxY protein